MSTHPAMGGMSKDGRLRAEAASLGNDRGNVDLDTVGRVLVGAARAGLLYGYEADVDRVREIDVMAVVEKMPTPAREIVDEPRERRRRDGA